MAGSKEDVISNLRAIIISSKGGLKLSDVAVDYREAFGVDVPLKTLACHNIKDVFIKYPQDFMVIGNRVQALSKPSSSHLVSLISKQRNGKKSGRSKLTKQDLSFRRPGAPFGSSARILSLPISPAKHNGKEAKINSTKVSPQTPIPKRTINNNIVKETKTEPKTPNRPPALMDLKVSPKDLPFTNVEDLSVTLASQLRLSKLKNMANRPPEPSSGPEQQQQQPRSPFRMSFSFLNNQTRTVPAVVPASTPLQSPIEKASMEPDSEYVTRLRNACSNRHLPQPVFKFMECNPKNQPKYFICKVRIGDDILLSSYPFEAPNEASAKDLASIKALTHIDNLNKSTTGNPGSETKETLDRIYDMIKSKEYGVWRSKLRNLYLETYNQEIQQDWFELVQKSPRFEITTVENVGYIIRTVAVPEGVVKTPEPAILASLKLPNSNQWEVYITNVVSSAEVWCRLIGKEYSEAYDSMMTKLELHPPTINVTHPVVGEIYLVNLEESWNRVRVVEVFPDKNEITVFLIDIGFEETVRKTQLFDLPNQFFSVAPQAILLSLNELDCLAECDQLKSVMLQLLLGNTFIAEVIAILDDGGNVSSVTLWDTSTAEDINVNAKLLDHLVKMTKRPVLPTIGIVKEMFVSYVDDNGDVYFQESKQNATFLDWIISTKIKNSKSLASPNSKRIDPTKLYAMRSSKTGLFYRAKLVKILDSNAVLMKFIDYGYEQQTAVDDLLDLEQTAVDLATIPSQVIRTRLTCLKGISSRILNSIRDSISEQNVLVKVVQYPPDSLPLVEVFKRSQTDGILSSISKLVDLKDDGEGSSGGGGSQTVEFTPRKKSYVVGVEVLTKNLPMPNIPPVGSYFSVFIPLSAHPGLFSVQPVSSHKELMELMLRLQEKCEKSFSKPLPATDFKIGELYAVKYSDDTWYRAYAHATSGPSTYYVCLCDFGDIIETSAEKLMHLPGEFKMFPYQAIRAYLAGIAPIEKDWTAIDCIKFRELVVEKQFVSQIIEINRDVKNPNFVSLGLILVDTSTSEDIYIHKVLIDKKMAVLKS